MALRLIPEIHRAAHRIGLYLENLPELEVTQAEAHILAHLAVYGEGTVADLHQAFAHKRSTLTSILDRLTERGLIRRVSHEEDRRTFVISLTPAGKKLARRVLDQLETLESSLVKKLSKAQIELIAEVLAAIGR